MRVPDEPVTITELDDVGGLAIRRVEQQQEDVGCLLRVDSKVDTVRRKRRAQRIVCALGDGLPRAMLEFVCHFQTSSRGGEPRKACWRCCRRASRKGRDW